MYTIDQCYRELEMQKRQDLLDAQAEAEARRHETWEHRWQRWKRLNIPLACMLFLMGSLIGWALFLMGFLIGWGLR